jgi:hypothetical protein
MTTVVPYFKIMSPNLCEMEGIVFIHGFKVQIMLLRRGPPILLLFLIQTCLIIFLENIVFHERIFLKCGF